MGKIYTKKGDKGETGLLGGSRIEKDDLRVSCYGTLDEANAMIGTAYSLIKNTDIREILHQIQQQLFLVGAELASDVQGRSSLKQLINRHEVQWLEEKIDHYQQIVGEQREFIIPGKSTGSALLHVARTIIRRAERNIISLNKNKKIREEILQYINRLSDTLFMLARMEEQWSFIEEIKNKVLEKLKVQNKEEYLNLEIVKKMAKAAEEKAYQIGVPIIFSVVDAGGNLMLYHRMDDALLVSIDISINKAYTSAFLKIPTHEVAPLVQPGTELYGLQWTNGNRIITFGGGYPLKVHHRIVGAIGVSGGSVEQDMTIAMHALRIFELERGE